jgi:uncharacterized protein (TIGR03083 family)
MAHPDPMLAAHIDVLTEIRGLAAALAPDEWARPIGCPGWIVQDAMSHVIGVELAMSGTPRPDHRVDPRPAHVRDDFGAYVEVDVDYRRSWPPDKVLAELESVVAERVTWLETVDPARLDDEFVGPFGPTTLGGFLPIRVLDLYMHEQDVRRATGRRGHDSGPTADYVVGRILRLWARELMSVPELAGRRIGVGVDGTSYVLDLTGEKGRATEGGETDVTVRFDVPNLLAWGGGRSDRVEPESTGDDALVASFLANTGFTP